MYNLFKIHKWEGNSSLKAFTLAEVLVVLAVIGVIASLTIPPVINNFQKKQWETGYKRTYSILEQATKMIMADNGGTMKGLGLTSHGPLKEVYANQFKVTRLCNWGNHKGNCWHTDNDWTYLDGSAPYTGGVGIGFINNHVLMTYFLSSTDCASTYYDFPNICGHVIFDTNGFKKPNVVGKDIHSILILKNSIIPYGVPGTGISIDTCKPGEYGTSCGLEILKGVYDYEN